MAVYSRSSLVTGGRRATLTTRLLPLVGSASSSYSSSRSIARKPWPKSVSYLSVTLLGLWSDELPGRAS